MTEEENESVLLERASVEEKAYNWMEAAKLYELVAKSFLDKKMVEKAALAYKNLGYARAQDSETADTADEYKNSNNLAITAYKKARNLFKQTKNRPEELECEAEIFNIKGVIAGSIMEAKRNFSESYELFIKSSEMYAKKEDQESIARTLCRGAEISCNLIFYCSDPKEIEEVYQKCIKIADESWKLSIKIGNIQSLAKSLITEGVASYLRPFIINFTREEHWRKYFKKYLEKCDKSIKFIEGVTDSKVLGEISFAAGGWYGYYGVFIEDIKKRREFIDKGLKLLEKAYIFTSNTKNKSLIIYSLFWINWFAILGGRFKYIQRRILKDVREIIELGRIFQDLYSQSGFFANLLPANYYTNFAQRSFIDPTLKKSFAEKGIVYANESLKANSFLPYSAWIYQILTSTYSQLVILATSEDEKDENIQKMLQYAKMAENISEKYESGYAKAAGYSSIYRAYKTLADIAIGKEDKIKMLSITINALEKYIMNEMESRGRIIGAQIRLGTLYQKLAIISMDASAILKARELFLCIINDSVEKGYYYYAAAAHEYIAHIEDRLGNHNTSAEHYKKAQETHIESLETIEYKPLKNRVKEKIDYACAWSLIERAKAYHKRENHLEAMENYQKACEILEKLPSYNYEALYYLAWNSLEEAEHFSKQERHQKAIERFETTIKNFNNSIKILENALKKSKEKSEGERIEKLKKLAKVRINYCSARRNVENARILAKNGEHVAAAEKFTDAASQFRDICFFFKIERERKELEAIYYLCKAWESMELGEQYKDPDRFLEAANLFTKACMLFADSKMKLLVSGNSAYCKALEHGTKFDKSSETKKKAQLYPKIKGNLRNAAVSYRKGGFEGEADWTLATSAYFDATWHLIKVDEEKELDEKKRLLEVVVNIFKSASELFGKAGYKYKEKEILEHLIMLEKEEMILVSALNTIKTPSITGSTVGIVAPACPLETSLSPKMSEIYKLTEESTIVLEERTAKKKYKLIYRNLLEEYPRIQRRECRVGIAQIGLSNTSDILRELYEEKVAGLLSLREDKVEIIRSNVKNMIEIANTKGINILLFPEMTIDLNYGELLKDISNLAKTYEMYIIPGSYHDQETKRNLSVVIGPNGILWEQEKHIPAIIHLEGKRFKEGIDVGITPRKTIICNTEFGRIAIIICRDFLDMDLRVELKNFEPPVDIILNPAFTPVTADFKAAHFDARRSIYAYCFFANVAEFGDSLIYTPEKERVDRMIQSKEENLIYKDIDLFSLRSERKKWEKEQNKERRFIQSTR